MHGKESSGRPPARKGKLLAAVVGLSGTVYPVGTLVALSGGGDSVDAYFGGDWLPLSWWEYTEVDPG
jgi:hypothetical protein